MGVCLYHPLEWTWVPFKSNIQNLYSVYKESLPPFQFQYRSLSNPIHTDMHPCKSISIVLYTRSKSCTMTNDALTINTRQSVEKSSWLRFIEPQHILRFPVHITRSQGRQRCDFSSAQLNRTLVRRRGLHSYLLWSKQCLKHTIEKG